MLEWICNIFAEICVVMSQRKTGGPWTKRGGPTSKSAVPEKKIFFSALKVQSKKWAVTRLRSCLCWLSLSVFDWVEVWILFSGQSQLVRNCQWHWRRVEGGRVSITQKRNKASLLLFCVLNNLGPYQVVLSFKTHLTSQLRFSGYDW